MRPLARLVYSRRLRLDRRFTAALPTKVTSVFLRGWDEPKTPTGLT